MRLAAHVLCLALLALPLAGAGVAPPRWSQLRQVLHLLTSEAGAVQLLAQSPALAARYPDPNAFTERMRPWRGHLTPLPATPAALDPEAAKLEMWSDPTKVVAFFTFVRPGSGGALTYVKLTYQAEGLALVECFRGFVREAPLKAAGPTHSGHAPAPRR